MSDAPPSDELTAARAARLRQELGDEGVPLLGGEALGEALAANKERAEELLVEELLYARHVPVHEGIRPSYGCLITADLPDEARSAELGLTILGHGTDESLHPLRQMVDGTATLLVRDLDGRVLVAQRDIARELGLVDLLAASKGISVQRLGDGRVRVGNALGFAVSDGHDWSARRFAASVMTELTRQLHLPGEGPQRLQRMRRLRSLLEFCFHSLSPNGIGATFVLVLDGDTSALDAGISDAGVEPCLPIDVFGRPDQLLLHNILASVDGACIVAPDGTLQRFKVKLTFPAAASRLIAEHGGTRHTSAKRFSYANPQTLVLVVSADGPVTLFCGGTAIGTLEGAAGSRLSWVRTTSAEVRRFATDEVLSETCGECGTVLALDLVREAQTGGHREVVCVVCENPVTSLDGVVDMQCRVKRPWE